MIAEDISDNYELVYAMLHHDYTIYHAWNGKEAVQMHLQYSPEIILMDINMPIMSGYEALKEIRKIDQKIPIIALTAYAYAEDETKMLSSGFDAYLSKPVKALKLKEIINSTLNNKLELIE